MENLWNKLRRFKNELMEPQEMSFLEEMCMTLSWEYPMYTLTMFVLSNCLLWMIAYHKIQILGVIFTVLLFNVIHEYVCGSKEKSEMPPSRYRECYNTIRSIISNLYYFREEHPAEFCFLMSVFFLVLAYIAMVFSGIMMSFLFLWGCFFVPLIYANLPAELDDKLREFVTFMSRIQGEIQEEDLIPPPIEDGKRADDNEDVESLDTDRTADSVTSSLISGITSMPSFLDAEDNHEILEEDLIPINPQNHELSPSLAEASSDSESELHDIRFKDSHFIRESSSEEEGNFEEGLHFEDTQNNTLPENKGLVHNIVDYVTSGGFQLPNFLNNAMTSKQSTEKRDISRNNSTSEDDFEIIDVDELKQ